MFTKAFWIATFQRVVRSFAASLGALLTADGTGILDSDWDAQFSAAGMAAFLTLLFCLAGEKLTNGAGPAFGTVEVTSPPAPPIDNDAGEVNLLTVVVGVVIGILVIWLLFAVTPLGGKDHDGSHGNDWERVVSVRGI